MIESRPPRTEWDDVAEALHGLANIVTVRSHYAEGHPAIARADAMTAQSFARFFERMPELVLAIIDEEFVVNERPLPELRARLPVLGDAMARHGVECIVFQRGMTAHECGVLARGLAQTESADPAKMREDVQASLVHVLLRLVELKSKDDARRHGTELDYFVPIVGEALNGAVTAIAEERTVDRAAIRAVAERLLQSCKDRSFTIEPRAYAAGVADDAVHATNVALMTGAMVLEAGYEMPACVDAVAAAILHDIGLVFLPQGLRGVPEPLVPEKDKARHRGHAAMGACALLAAGCPALWVSAALEHHRGVDGGGYPTLATKSVPHEMVRMISLASFVDLRRTRVGDRGDDPEEALSRASELEEKYFGRSTVRIFLRALGAYPPGTCVELTNRAVALVVQADPGDPLRPRVRVLYGEDEGKRVELRKLDPLEDRHVLSIARAVPPPLALRDIEADDEPPPSPAPLPPTPIVVPESLAPPARMSLAGFKAPTAPPPRPPTSVPPRSRYPLPPPIASSAPPPRASTSPSAAPADLGPLDSVPRVVMAPAELTKLSLDPRAGFVLSRVDGVTSLEEILDMCGMPREDATAVLLDLVAKKIIELH